MLGLPALAPAYRYTAVLGDAEGKAFAAMAHAYAAQGFRDFKVKVSGDSQRDAAKLQALAALDPPPSSVRVDANNLWTSPVEAIAALQAIGGSLAGIEEPIGAGQWPALSRIAEEIGAPIILDESVTRAADLDALPDPASHWIVNVRVSKMGGLLRSLDVVAAARRRGTPNHRRRAGRRDERADARGAHRRHRGRRPAGRPGGRIRHAPPDRRRLRPAADVRTRRRADVGGAPRLTPSRIRHRGDQPFA